MSERQIAQSLTTRHGTVMRDNEDPLPGLSSICLLDDGGQVLWFAELPQKDDSYRDDMTLLDEDTLGLTSWFGWRCRIALRDGTIIGKEWTH
jgi:hypothetical protein